MLICLGQSDTAYQTFEEHLFLHDTAASAKLYSTMNHAQYLDAISAPSSGKGTRKKVSQKRNEDPIEISDESDESDESGDEAEDESRVSEMHGGEAMNTG